MRSTRYLLDNISTTTMDEPTKQPRFPSEGASDSSSQDHCSSSGQISRLSNKGQIRHRASIACASCRERRIRCVVPDGSTECTQCKRSGTECIIKNDDERRRYVSTPDLLLSKYANNPADPYQRHTCRHCPVEFLY